MIGKHRTRIKVILSLHLWCAEAEAAATDQPGSHKASSGHRGPLGQQIPVDDRSFSRSVRWPNCNDMTIAAMHNQRFLAERVWVVLFDFCIKMCAVLRFTEKVFITEIHQKYTQAALRVEQ